jgi:choline dehydrogenase-like flavoprotein
MSRPLSVVVDRDSPRDGAFDCVVIGSGFGGAMAAQALVDAGKRVLVIERGDWVARGPENWMDESIRELSPAFSAETPCRIIDGARSEFIGAFNCVGGASVYFGGVAFRYRQADFDGAPEIVGDSGAAWPYGYDDLAPYYDRAEELLGLSGEDGADPTEPPRRTRYRYEPPPLAPASERIAAAARSLGLRPSRIPLAINFREREARPACVRCGTCDGFACAVSAKNDVASTIIAPLLRRGMQLATETVAVRLVERARRIVAVECVDKRSNRVVRYHARNFVLAAGAIATPHLVLASRIDRLNPGGELVGRYLMRLWNAAVLGFFPKPPNPTREFHKQLAFMDFYFGHHSVRRPRGRLGSLQQFSTPPEGLVKPFLPGWTAPILLPWVKHLTGLLAIAEDQPVAENRVWIDPGVVGRFELPQLMLRHAYSRRDVAAGRALVRQARRILRRAGAIVSHAHEIRTFSHALGTMRMGIDETRSVLDGECRFRGIENLYVADASALPTSASVNPSLTISANALRAAERLSSDGSRWAPHEAFSADAATERSDESTARRRTARAR